MAFAIEISSKLPENHVFLVSDAAQILDDVDVKTAQSFAMTLSPLRTIDYLMKRNAEAHVRQAEDEVRKLGTSKVLRIELASARKIIDASSMRNTLLVPSFRTPS